MLEAKHVTKTYATKTTSFDALQDVSVSIAEKESVAILGKSGSGKSTLMRLLAGLDTPTKGDIIFNGQVLSKMSENDLARLRNKSFGFVFQQFFLQPQLSVRENIELPLRIQEVDAQTIRERSDALLQAVELTDKANNKAVDLSGGQKQRVALARALITNPSVIFADEPTGNLDEETGAHIINLLFSLHKKDGITLIIVTHDADLAALCNRTIHIKDGRILS